MSTVHCPLCGLRYRWGSELDVHVREDHAPPAHLNCPPPRERPEDERVVAAEPVLHLPW